jgi:hypothetical protein
VVPADDGRGIAEERPEVVDAAAHAFARIASRAGVAAFGLIADNGTGTNLGPKTLSSLPLLAAG